MAPLGRRSQQAVVRRKAQQHRDGTRRQSLVHRGRHQPDRDDQPDDTRHHRVPHPHGRQRTRRESRRGPDGNLWFTELGANQIGMINPTTHAITEFPIPTANSFDPTGITTGPDGNLWFTENVANQIGMINPTTARHHRVPHPHDPEPAPGNHGGARRQSLVHRSLGNQIGMINPTTRRHHRVPRSPRPRACPWNHDRARRQPLVHRESGADQIGMINPTTHAITEFPIGPALSTPPQITAGPDGNLWFTEAGAGQIGMINPTTHAITEFATNYVNSEPAESRPAPTAISGSPITAPRSRCRPPEQHALHGIPATAFQRHRGHPLRPDGQGRERLGRPRHFLQRHGHGGPRQEPRRSGARRHAHRDGNRRSRHIFRAHAEQGRRRLQHPGFEQRCQRRDHQLDHGREPHRLLRC